jgi:hypothetical protein
MDDEMLIWSLAQDFNLPVFSLKNVTIQKWVLDLLPWSVVHHSLVVPFCLHEGRLTVLTPVPLDQETIEALQKLSGYVIEQALALPGELRQQLEKLVYH